MGKRVVLGAAPALVIALLAVRALSSPQGPDQIKCITTLNANAAQLSGTLAKQIGKCLVPAASGQLGPLPLTGQLETCFVADRDHRLFSGKQKAQVRESKKCPPGVVPAFGVPALQGAYDVATNNYSNVVNPAAIALQLALSHDILGDPADAAVTANTAAALCQQQILKAAQACVAAKLKAFNRCKKVGLKSGSIGSAADLATQCLMTNADPASGQPDPSGSIAGRCGKKLTVVRAGQCGSQNLSTLFPGICGEAADFATCLVGRASCRVCEELNRIDDLTRDCDLIDDGLSNGSCPAVLPQCGDGILDAGTEQCDDGNTADGDCCSSSCQFESAGAACADGTASECNAPDTCDGAGTCQANTVASGTPCGDPTANECTAADTCDGEGACQANNVASGTACGDPTSNECTLPDTCDGSGTCQNHDAAAGTGCGDPADTVCTDPDTCNGAGLCERHDVADGTACADDGNQCTSDACNAGVCSHPSLGSGTPCGSAADTDCTAPDTCDGAGVCQPNNATPGSACASDGIECTNDVCDAAGACAHPNAVVGTACGDQSATTCTAPDSCDGLGSCLRNDVVVGTACASDGNQCTDNICDGVGSCAHPNKTAGTACADDGSECTNDQCNGGGSCIHPPKTAGTACSSDGNICTDDQCNGAGTCAHLNNTAPCSDGLFCNGTDTCSGGNCAAHSGNPCPGPNGNSNCHESCDESTDSCTGNDPNGSACNDGLSCNDSDTCLNGSCSVHSGVCCGTVDFTFTVNSNTGGAFSSAAWPGGTQSQTSSTGCSVTINNPNDNIDKVCGLANPFSVNSFSGFSSCVGSGGEDGDGCEPVYCPPAGIGSCCSNRPSCSAALNGSGQARFHVHCTDS